MSEFECPRCGQTYRPSAGHCMGGAYGGCCSSFAAGGDFDAHRVGEHENGQRRCLTVPERLDKGWTTDTPYPAGDPRAETRLWVSPHTLRSRERMAARVDDLRGASPVIP